MRNNPRRPALGLFFLAVSVACGGPPETSPEDAGHADAGHLDAGQVDAGHVDAGASDAAHVDEPDAAHVDEPDAGHVDEPDAGAPDAGPRCVPSTCEVLVGTGAQECGAFDDGCGGTVECDCAEGSICAGSPPECVCVERLTHAEACARAMTCGLVTVAGSCGPVIASCTDPVREPDAVVCAREGCGTFEVTGSWCSWTVHCGCAAGSVCDPDTDTCIGLTDARDGRTYPIVRIGEQIWMAKNLEYDAPGSECVSPVPNVTDCWRWGRYYRWSTAMAGAAASEADPSGVQGVCPAGWHLPSDAEVVELMTFVERSSGTPVAPHLKHFSRSSPVSWESGFAYDSYGFNLFPAGWKTAGIYAQGLNREANFWTSSHRTAPRRYAFSPYDHMYSIDNDAGLMVSVRCVRD